MAGPTDVTTHKETTDVALGEVPGTAASFIARHSASVLGPVGDTPPTA
jgi:hypothetical protein